MPSNSFKILTFPNIYSKPYYCQHPNLYKCLTLKRIKCKFAFQIRQRPNSYNIGQQTIGANYIIDNHFSNNQIEWYTKENIGIVVYGLLLKFEEN